MKIKRKNAELALLFGLCFSVIMSFAGFDAKCDNLRNNILRLHIIANSDSKEDQNLKLKVRDEILKVSSEDFSCCKSINDAVYTAKVNIGKINKAAENIIKENGFGYSCVTSVSKEYFDIREYDDFTLPAGEYNSLVLKIGKAKGHNWWCVIFPGVCLPAADGEVCLEQSVEKSAAEVAYNSENYVMKFKTAEIYEKIRNKFKKIAKK